MVAIYHAYYNFSRVHQTLRVDPRDGSWPYGSCLEFGRTRDTIGPQIERDRSVTISTNIVGWFRLLLFAFGAAYLWRSGLSPRKGEPKTRLDRGLRIFGALLLSAVVIYFLGVGFGFYGSN